MATILEAETRPDIRVEDVEYQRQGGQALLARLYRPAGTGPFPAVVQVHGGAWVNKDRTDNDFIARAFAESGILVASLDFRMPPDAPYPASLADINLGVRWLKARARTYGSRPDWVGLFGTSSGGHQVLLAAMRPDDPRPRREGAPAAGAGVWRRQRRMGAARNHAAPRRGLEKGGRRGRIAALQGCQ